MLSIDQSIGANSEADYQGPGFAQPRLPAMRRCRASVIALRSSWKIGMSRGLLSMSDYSGPCPEGTDDNSPAIHRWAPIRPDPPRTGPPVVNWMGGIFSREPFPSTLVFTLAASPAYRPATRPRPPEGVFPVLALPFGVEFAKWKERGRFSPRLVERRYMSRAFTNYFWFYFSAPGRGTGGCL
jgi:hypothetical protein